ncbi:pantetheine-phosphate adenylyltransferase [Antarcticibacterium sp. 1MA-6-2]|uniref:pantetheine-phosphate adenylyltransferase n=1 Tax=Antarcticibacterium sp. 1MA-6-2 TaxID=2908210 RepID=UPI001F323647|nr:pantetheine-phosphate adenylyltransferase [Antarcticibacterium sp. 1MA-6-2]UJH91126.1 pantetheine-phosphate adenylyltransferase [Antarcticibacterium sp. 1MA-6-2]
MRRAVFPGSFDPVTLGHVDIIERALPLFDEIILAIGINADKKYAYPLEERVKFLKDTFQGEAKIKVDTYEGLTVDFCKEADASFILRGLRNSIDMEYEKTIGQANFKMSGIETVFLISSPGKSYISSTVVKDIKKNGGNFSHMVPEAVNK